MKSAEMKNNKKKINRKEFLKLGVQAGAVLAVSSLAAPKSLKAEAPDGEVPQNLTKAMDLSSLPKEIVQKNELLRMQDELARALQKPVQERRWIMVLDVRKCVGCFACTIACKAENVLPPGVVYRVVMEEEHGKYPNVSRRFISRPCLQCDNPPCVPVCPVKATYKRPDGIVEIDYNKCIGCKYCLVACPYNARCSDFGEYYTKATPKLQDYELRPNYEYHKKWPRKKGKSPMGNARKCHFCIHRIERGMLPSCVTTCIGGATYFGDKNDSDSLVAKLISQGSVTRLKEEQGTNPGVYHLL